MKFLVVGLGSMGKRRIRNLKALGISDIIGFDTSEEKCKDVSEQYNVKTFDNLDEAMKHGVDAMIISTPPDKHISLAVLAAKNNKHFFTEVNVLSDLSKIEELIELTRNKNIVAAPSRTLVHNILIKKIKEILDSGVLGKPLSFTHHCGQYLPDWHPWEDYRKFYVSARETGACREMVVFELAWIKWLLGDVEEVSCMKGKLSDLEADIDDVYQILAKFNNKVIGHMLIDVVSRHPYREFRLLCENGVIVWDMINKVLKVFNSDEKGWEEFKETSSSESGYIAGEEMYIEEMKEFVDAVSEKGKYDYTFADELETLKTLLRAEESSVVI